MSQPPSPHGIPTKYNCIRFRSRLEAKWAAFFDLCGWAWDYEPFDLAGWIPDFLIRGRKPLLVEIKPAVEFPNAAGVKILEARPEQDVLLLGLAPEFRRVSGAGINTIRLGWLYAARDGWNLPLGRWHDALIGHAAGTQTTDIASFETGWAGYVSGLRFDCHDLHAIRERWHEAGNVTQWRPASS